MKTISEVAALAGCSASSIHRSIASKALKADRVLGRLVIADVEAARFAASRPRLDTLSPDVRIALDGADHVFGLELGETFTAVHGGSARALPFFRGFNGQLLVRLVDVEQYIDAKFAPEIAEAKRALAESAPPQPPREVSRSKKKGAPQ